jgi:aminopeptidase N
VKANFGDIGYFRVSYDADTFSRLVANLSKLGEADRLNLLNDTWALVQAQRIKAADFLGLATKLASDESPSILESLLFKIATIDELQRDQPGRKAFQAWARALHQPQFARLGWDPKANESPLAGQLRGQLVGTLGQLGDEEILRETRTRFAAFLEKPESLPGDLRRPVLSLIGRDADAATWEKLHQLGRAENSLELKRLYYRSMATARDPALAAKTLQLALGAELVAEDAARLVEQVAQDGEQPQLAWDFAREHLDALHAKLSALRANDYVPNLFRAFSEAARADELEAFAKQKLPPGAANAVARAADQIRFQAEFKAQFLPQLDAWTREHAAP